MTASAAICQLSTSQHAVLATAEGCSSIDWCCLLQLKSTH